MPAPPGAQLGGVGPASPPPPELELPAPLLAEELPELLPEPGPSPDDEDAVSLAPASRFSVPVFEVELPHPAEKPNAAASALTALHARCEPDDGRIPLRPEEREHSEAATLSRRRCPLCPARATRRPDMPAKKTSTARSGPASMSKATFIHSLLPSVPVNEVVARAQAKGLNITRDYVRWVRWQNKSPAKEQVTKPSKSEFIRRQPASMSAKEVVAKAKTDGLRIDVNQVYKVRGSEKTTTKKKVTKVAARRSTVRKRAPVPRPITTTSSAETLLTALAAEIGLGRAIEVLQGERARVQSILRG